jgi:hypothetical protein
MNPYACIPVKYVSELMPVMYNLRRGQAKCGGATAFKVTSPKRLLQPSFTTRRVIITGQTTACDRARSYLNGPFSYVMRQC